jgi:hypothetical protein
LHPIAVNWPVNFNAAVNKRFAMRTATKKNQLPTNEEIARYAYFLWESEGRIHGRDTDYWLQAEAHLKATREQDAAAMKSSAIKPKIPAKKLQEPASTPKNARFQPSSQPKGRRVDLLQRPPFA